MHDNGVCGISVVTMHRYERCAQRNLMRESVRNASLQEIAGWSTLMISLNYITLL